ncbi:carbohydrate ABC transporter membrane protein 2, CUT1 family (TC 3.A.1.1.-) [Thermoanaerobacter uzonensis DSM 18761]|uniref:Carbohydrate ABC transporter membrane protein 2, CUT1 family (TC 3.A.1.1.-) n=1 Tax=Thermoanaerobacter uzonensis DSM 18761 TaxID=1123369 RepID=A0A1M4ZSL8_9THEO|nr:carbohydrate ABC transporter permease [Thermoanaerobacter uzonensis]SHF20536.1 carbohydrate ABC transporter membrane protein 2, CUT1 family (TC 3.A.1.1.-) [Thermoanaerobacter uzonensis DSM 18761]
MESKVRLNLYKHKKTINLNKLIPQVILHLILICGSITMLVPFIWMISTSLKDIGQVFIIPPVWIPHPIRWSNYIKAWTALPFANAYINSIKIAAIVVTATLLTSSMAAYAFAKIKFPGRDTIFIIFLATMMVPGQVTMIPTFILMKYIGWIDTHLPLIVPPSLFNAFGVFLLRQFMLSLPKELDEAAIIDGANHWFIYWEISLPLITPALSALGIFSFMGTWNNFMGPLIYLNTPEKFTVPLLLNFFKGMYITDWTLMMAASAIAIIPVLIVYLIGQKYIIEGVALTGIKA